MTTIPAHIHYGDTDPAVLAAPAPTTARELEAEAAWLAVSGALTDAIGDICSREDLIVRAVAETGAGAPAMFTPATATVEVSRAVFGPIDPESIRPHLPGDRYRYPAAWGGLIHEAAHADHSTWTPSDVPRSPSNAVAAAVLLEESRIEAAHLAHRPQDRLWLRAGTTSVVWPELSTTGITGRAAAAQAAALVLARVDAGILTEDETHPMREAIEQVLGADVLAELQDLWCAAHTLADHDRAAMLELGQAWCRVIGQDPAEPAAYGSRCSPSTATPGAMPDGSASTGNPTSAAIGAAATSIGAVVAADVVSSTAGPAQAAHREAETHVRIVKGTRAAKKVFGRDLSRTRTRPPTPAERGAAATLAKQLRAAAFRDRAVTKTAAELPPGRLRMRAAMARDAQRAAGAIPTAKPFSAVQRRTVDQPPLRVGIAVDTSGSMICAERPLASAAWIIATAIAAADPASVSATIGFGHGRLKAFTKPGQAPAAVPIFKADGGDERFCEAVDALDAVLGLTAPGSARLLVVVSDGQYFSDEKANGAKRVKALTDSGCAVLWLTLTGHSLVIPGATEVVVSNPATAAAEIGHAAVKALTGAR